MLEDKEYFDKGSHEKRSRFRDLVKEYAKDCDGNCGECELLKNCLEMYKEENMGDE